MPHKLGRRGFLGASLGGVAACTWADASLLLAKDDDYFRPDTLFLSWQRDPTTTMLVQWVGPKLAPEDAIISYAADGTKVWQTAAPIERDFPKTDLKLYRAELAGLAAGAEHRFKIGSKSAAFRFRTMPAKANDEFTFVSGGDCGTNGHAVANNKLAARQDPMFALIGGDLAYDNGRSADVFLQFLRNYSQHMIDRQGRLIPLVPTIGNHEVHGGYGRKREDGPFYFALFDGLFAERSYATLDFGDYLSLVLLDTGHVAKIEGEQTDWLDKSLAERIERPHVFVANHVPAYPSYREPGDDEHPGTGGGNRKHWVPLFEKHNVDLVLEHHEHTFKRSHPMLGGLQAENGVLYLGDGSWGQLRPASPPSKRPYLAVSDGSYHLTVHRIEGERRFHLALEEGGRIMDIVTTTKRPRRSGKT